MIHQADALDAVGHGAARGVYAFDRAAALRGARRDAWGRPPWDPAEFARVEDSYAANWALRPYRRSLGSPWEFSWVGAPAGGGRCEAPGP